MGAIDLTDGFAGAPPLWLLAGGEFSTAASGAAPHGLAAAEALVRAARWISTRSAHTFEEVAPGRGLDDSQARALLAQARGALAAAAVAKQAHGSAADQLAAAELRSAALTVLAHLLATALHAPAFAAVARDAAADIFAFIDAETGPGARPMLRAHAVLTLQRRGAALTPAEQTRAQALLRGLVRSAPPYADLPGPWAFAMCSDPEFHDGECDLLVKAHGFKEVAPPDGAPTAPRGTRYRAFEAPFATPDGKPLRVLARTSEMHDENHEMGLAYFTGVLINRHAQLGSFDLVATSVTVEQHGYKLMMNSQCAGLTTRFALTRMFPDADIYSSFDSTMYQQHGGKVTASEGGDCFVAILTGLSKHESHAQIAARIRQAQWNHGGWAGRDFTQFVGPADPLLLARLDDVNRDGKGDAYDGFLDFRLKDIAERVHDSATPRDPGCAPSQISGEAASGLDWAAGSMDRVTRYSEFWQGLPKSGAFKYTFQAGGFFSLREPPPDLAVGNGPKQALERLPALCRYTRKTDSELTCEVMFQSYLSHAAKELKRMLCAAEAWWRALDLGHLAKTGPLATPLGQRGALLLMLRGLIDFPADRNFLSGLWAMALAALNLPPLSDSLVEACITEKDHDADHYYGSIRGLKALVGDGAHDTGLVGRTDPAAHHLLSSDDPRVGRAGELVRS